MPGLIGVWQLSLMQTLGYSQLLFQQNPHSFLVSIEAGEAIRNNIMQTENSVA